MFYYCKVKVTLIIHRLFMCRVCYIPIPNAYDMDRINPTRASLRAHQTSDVVRRATEEDKKRVSKY